MPSKKLRAASSAPEDDLQVDMSPMIDMVFLLLIFFIVASSAIVVKQDPSVEPPVAKNSESAKSDIGRIVVNVRTDGTFAGEIASNTLADENAISEYVTTRMREEEDSGKTNIVLHLRGDKAAAFKYSRTVIRAAAAVKVNKVVFSVYPFAPTQ